ncbi:hypothetical protein ACV1C5_13140, partial [Aeromonas caviae]
MFNTLSLFRSLCFVFILLGFNPNISVAATQVSPSGEGANKRGNSSRLTQSFHFFSLSRSF